MLYWYNIKENESINILIIRFISLKNNAIKQKFPINSNLTENRFKVT